jgi:undecaprenyl-diphosphatase
LLVPVVLGAVIYKGLKNVVLNPLPAGSTGPFIVGTLAAAAVGFVVIDVLLGYVRRHTYGLFVIYRLVLAAIIVIVILSGARDATF